MTLYHLVFLCTALCYVVLFCTTLPHPVTVNLVLVGSTRGRWGEPSTWLAARMLLLRSDHRPGFSIQHHETNAETDCCGDHHAVRTSTVLLILTGLRCEPYGPRFRKRCLLRRCGAAAFTFIFWQYFKSSLRSNGFQAGCAVETKSLRKKKVKKVKITERPMAPVY